MSRFDLRFVRRHPLRWVRVMWLPFVLAAAFVGLAFISASRVFEPLVGRTVWSILFGITAGVLVMSALAPLVLRVQAVSAGVLLGVALLRLGALLHVVELGILPPAQNIIALNLILHWVIVAALAVRWPVLLEEHGQRMAAAVGVDDRAAG